jgi:hypothetical protein
MADKQKLNSTFHPSYAEINSAKTIVGIENWEIVKVSKQLESQNIAATITAYNVMLPSIINCNYYHTNLNCVTKREW